MRNSAEEGTYEIPHRPRSRLRNFRRNSLSSSVSTRSRQLDFAAAVPPSALRLRASLRSTPRRPFPRRRSPPLVRSLTVAQVVDQRRLRLIVANVAEPPIIGHPNVATGPSHAVPLAPTRPLPSILRARVLTSPAEHVTAQLRSRHARRAVDARIAQRLQRGARLVAANAGRLFLAPDAATRIVSPRARDPGSYRPRVGRLTNLVQVARRSRARG
ncbi:hypothetical protein AURDEDRAFT_172326 [Auricularia subglabra TFB-10046 SS5]|nr:hypothetical protein AURDEDRAFT_172326 [Auricularia subglabra TFB-10046 SS5]